MVRTAREHLFSFIMLGILIGTILLLIPIFGPQPLSNPIAAGIILTEAISLFCWFSAHRLISAARKGNKQLQQESIMHEAKLQSVLHEQPTSTKVCPSCNASIPLEMKFCTTCGYKNSR